jgi:hypothetical protein
MRSKHFLINMVYTGWCDGVRETILRSYESKRTWCCFIESARLAMPGILNMLYLAGKITTFTIFFTDIPSSYIIVLCWRIHP